MWERLATHKAVAQLSTGELDLVVGELTTDDPWTEIIGSTRPYLITDDTRTGQHVMAVRRGENAWLVELERYLKSRETEVHGWYVAAQ